MFDESFYYSAVIFEQLKLLGMSSDLLRVDKLVSELEEVKNGLKAVVERICDLENYNRALRAALINVQPEPATSNTTRLRSRSVELIGPPPKRVTFAATVKQEPVEAPVRIKREATRKPPSRGALGKDRDFTFTLLGFQWINSFCALFCSKQSCELCIDIEIVCYRLPTLGLPTRIRIASKPSSSLGTIPQEGR